MCGNTTTTAGLTVAVSKEGKGGDVAIEAGALVRLSAYLYFFFSSIPSVALCTAVPNFELHECLSLSCGENV